MEIDTGTPPPSGSAAGAVGAAGGGGDSSTSPAPASSSQEAATASNVQPTTISEAPPKKEAARADAACASMARLIATTKIPSALVHSVVLSYLLRNCHRETAHAFLHARELEQSAKLQHAHITHSMRVVTEATDVKGEPSAPMQMETAISADAEGGEGESEMDGDYVMTPVTERTQRSNGVSVGETEMVSSSTSINKNAPLRSRFPSDVFERLDRRKRVLNLVREGDVQAAITAADALLPTKGGVENHGGLRGYFPSLYFRLSCQHFIELIRQRRTSDALKFAQTKLGPLGRRDKDFMDLMPEYLPLIAYPEPEKSPLGMHMKKEKRDLLADELNDCIYSFDMRNTTATQSNTQALSSSSPTICERWSHLERLLRQLTVTLDKMRHIAASSTQTITVGDVLKSAANIDI